ncbi:hypothetical protein QR680_015569 [Steinernema hermaphroditum]|uniref:Uncharacterized protein n=1 Tax=Steinernema hermaphroditum TaxID=289476 RepID=A0AA39H886_9BILA|nr:hypothetical protein QR680_015569 [Steinernema hermaphroditum]
MCNVVRVTKLIAWVILIICIINIQLQRSRAFHLGFPMLIANGAIFWIAIGLAFKTYDCTPSIPLAIVCVGLCVTVALTVVLLSTVPVTSGYKHTEDFYEYLNRSKQQRLQ